MRIRFAAVLALLLTLALGAALSQARSWAAAEPDVAQLVEELRGGGYVIFVRHAATNWYEEAKEESMRASGRLALEDCSAQRNLSERGRAQAERLGVALRALGIPVSRVAASLYCRCLDTARLAFGWAEPSTLLTAGKAERAQALRDLVNRTVLKGNNTVLVGHGDMMRAGFGIDLREAESAILKPDRSGNPQLIAHVRLEAWEALVEEQKMLSSH